MIPRMLKKCGRPPIHRISHVDQPPPAENHRVSPSIEYGDLLEWFQDDKRLGSNLLLG
jgi:hypothetical protein